MEKSVSNNENNKLLLKLIENILLQHRAFLMKIFNERKEKKDYNPKEIMIIDRELDKVERELNKIKTTKDYRVGKEFIYDILSVEKGGHVSILELNTLMYLTVLNSFKRSVSDEAWEHFKNNELPIKSMFEYNVFYNGIYPYSCTLGMVEIDILPLVKIFNASTHNNTTLKLKEARKIFQAMSPLQEYFNESYRYTENLISHIESDKKDFNTSIKQYKKDVLGGRIIRFINNL